MSGFMGMDTGQVDEFGGLLTQNRETVDQRFQDLRGMVDSIVGAQWIGPDADAFQSRYQGDVVPKVTSAVERMQQLFDELRQHIEEQDTASSANDIGGAGGSGGGADEPGFWEKFGKKFIDNIKPSWMGGAGFAISGAHNLPGYLLENVPKFVPILGDVYTGLLSGAQRFGNESHLPMGERIGRAVLDGALTGLGSFAGGLIGSVGGAFLGVLAGGGTVATAGAAGGAVLGAGVGAIPGAIAGAGAGAIAGGITGAIIGDFAGGYFGAAAGNALASAILD